MGKGYVKLIFIINREDKDMDERSREFYYFIQNMESESKNLLTVPPPYPQQTNQLHPNLNTHQINSNTQHFVPASSLQSRGITSPAERLFTKNQYRHSSPIQLKSPTSEIYERPTFNTVENISFHPHEIHEHSSYQRMSEIPRQTSYSQRIQQHEPIHYEVQPPINQQIQNWTDLTSAIRKTSTFQFPETQSRIQYVPYESYYIDYEERAMMTSVKVPVQRRYTDYYAVEHITQYIPQEYEERTIEMVPEEKIYKKIVYIPVQTYKYAQYRSLVHVPNDAVQFVHHSSLIQPGPTLQKVINYESTHIRSNSNHIRQEQQKEISQN